VLLVVVTKVEARAVLDLFEAEAGRKAELHYIGDKTYHEFGVIGGAKILMVQSEMGAVGLGASLLTVQDGIRNLSPSAVIMFGVAFGVNAEMQSIGDILVSQQLMMYDLQRVGTDGGQLNIIMRGDRAHASPRLLNLFRTGDLKWEGPRVRFGLILSGEKLVDNQDFRDQLTAFELEAVGGDMEGAGLYVAAQSQKVDWILVKAICDWADGHKAQDKDQRQQLASQNAARFTLHVMRQGGLGRQSSAARAGPSPDPGETGTAPVSTQTYRGTHTFKFQLVDILLSCWAMVDQNTREAVLHDLPDVIRSGIQRSPVAHVDVGNIVTACLDYPGGFESLVEVLRFYERDSLCMQKVEELVRRARD